MTKTSQKFADTETLKPYSFEPGFSQIPVKDVKRVQREIMTGLKLKTKSSWYQRLYGNVEPKISEARFIASVLARFGVKTDIWGDPSIKL